MARQGRSRDWQERAFEETEIQRRDRAAGAAGGMPGPLKSTADLPRRPSWRWSAIGLAVVIVAVLIRNGLESRAPSLTTSCTTPAMALSSTSTHRGSDVRWSATGPAAMHFGIFIGTARLVHLARSRPGELHPVPDPGGSAATARGLIRATAMSTDCKAHGDFSVDVPPGHYTVRLFRFDGSGAAVTGTAVATKLLTVSS